MFLKLQIISMIFVPSIFVYDVEHTSFHVGLCGRNFVLYLFGECPGICTICHSWQHTGVVHLSLQADGNVDFEDILVFGVFRPACHDHSLYLFPLLFSLRLQCNYTLYSTFSISTLLNITTTFVFSSSSSDQLTYFHRIVIV